MQPEEYKPHVNMMDNFDLALCGVSEMSIETSTSYENKDVREALSFGLTEPIDLSNKSPANALLEQLNRINYKRSRPSSKGFETCTGIITIAISYAHFENGSSSKLSQEQAEKSIEYARKIAEAQPHEIKSVRFWVDQMISQEMEESLSHDEFIHISLLPFYRLPVVSVAQESSIRRSARLMLENSIISQSSFNLSSSSKSEIPRIFPFPATSDSAEYKVASMIIAGLFDGLDHSAIDKEYIQRSDIVRWACKLFCKSKEMKKIYKINTNIDEKPGYGFFMGADWWWSTVGKLTCQSRDRRRYHHNNKLSDASMIGMSSHTLALLSSKDQEDLQTFLAAFSHYTPSNMPEHQYYGTTFPLSYIWVNLSCDSVGPYLNMEYIQSENTLCPVRNANFSIGSKKLGLMKRRRISRKTDNNNLYNRQFSLMENEKLLSSDYLRKFENIFESHYPVKVLS